MVAAQREGGLQEVRRTIVLVSGPVNVVLDLVALFPQREERLTAVRGDQRWSREPRGPKVCDERMLGANDTQVSLGGVTTLEEVAAARRTHDPVIVDEAMLDAQGVSQLTQPVFVQHPLQVIDQHRARQVLLQVVPVGLSSRAMPSSASCWRISSARAHCLSARRRARISIKRSM